MNASVHKTTLWIARITGTIILLFFLYFLLVYVVGIGQEQMSLSSAEDWLTFVAFPVWIIIGLGISLKEERIGGLITIAGNVLLLIIRPELIYRFYLLLPVLPGILYVLYSAMKRRSRIAD